MARDKIPLTTLAGCKWWQIKVSDSAEVAGTPTADLAEDIYEETLAEFESLMRKDSEQKWLRQVISTGTHADQVAALITLTQMSPVLAIPHLRQLLTLAQTKATRIIQPALTALKRLMVEELLPARRLKFFAEQTVSGPIYKSTLLLWHFEDFVKKAIATFVQLLFDAQSSPIETVRSSCVDFSFDILACINGANVTGEQEKPMLKLLVKALGDKSEKRVSAKAQLLLRKLAARRPHMKEQIVDEVREQHLVTHESYSRGISLACSLFSAFPLNAQDDAFVAGRLVEILSELTNKIIAKKEKMDKKRKLEAGCGLTDADARLLRLSLKALETALAAAGSDSPLPATTNSLLIRLAHETQIPGLAVAILNLLNGLSKELKTDSPKLLRAIFGQCGSSQTYLGASLPWLLSLVKQSVLEDAFVKPETKMAFRRRLLQVACVVAEPSVLPVVMALVEPKQLEIDLHNANAEDEDVVRNDKFGYNAGFWDPVTANVQKEPTVWERNLLKHHFEDCVRTAADSLPVEVPDEAKSLSQMLVDVSTMQTDEEKRAKKRKKVDLEDAEVEMPGII